MPIRQQHPYLPFLMWVFPLLFFAYQFILRLWPSLMMNQIMLQFSIDATGFGLLAAVYYYGYAGLQIPIAILLDKFGPRYVIAGCALLCGLATFTFSFSSDWYVAYVSRFLIGAGSAVGFLGASKVISEWFPKDTYAKMVGFSFTFGLMGAHAGKPISLLMETHGWQEVAFILSCASMALAGCIYLFLRSPKTETLRASEESFTLGHFRMLLSSPVIWLLALANFLMVGILEGFADVWGIPYLMTLYNYTKGDAAALTMFIFTGMLCGGPLLAILSKRLSTYTVLTLSGLGMVIIFCILLFTMIGSWYILAGLFFLLGILCCYQVIIFVAGSDLVPPALLGVTIAFLNSINMLGGSFFHTTIGYLMDAAWTGDVSCEGVRIYTLSSYETALVIIPIAALLGTGIVAGLGVKLRQYK